MNKPEKYMFESFEQYCEIMKITMAHPYYEAFELIWRMARSPAWADDYQGSREHFNDIANGRD